MSKEHLLRLHWKLFFPLLGLLWLIIGITIFYFVSHERERQQENLENRLMNVNSTVIDAYNRGIDLQNTVEFIRLFTDNTTLTPLRITVYDRNGIMVADNPAATIEIFDTDGRMKPEMRHLWETRGNESVSDIIYDRQNSMICSQVSPDGRIYSFAALPYEGEVLDFLSIDPMVWVLVIILGIIASVFAFFGVRTICRNVYSLQDFARIVSSDKIPTDIDTWKFSNDELGDVSRNLLLVYKDKIHAEQEKIYHERQIGMNISHELNTPVGIIKGYIDSILNDKDMLEELKHKFLERIQQNTDRLATLVGDVDKVLRLEDSGGSIIVDPVDFHDMVARVGVDIRQGHIADGLSFEADVPEGCRVMAYEPLLVNALLNLVNNAALHSKGTKMAVRWLREENGHHIFTFSDNGVGVDEQHIDRLFDLFYRADSGRSRKLAGGSGLGLPFVRRIIIAMGGEITVANAPGGGLTFTFTLPAAPAPAAKSDKK